MQRFRFILVHAEKLALAEMQVGKQFLSIYPPWEATEELKASSFYLVLRQSHTSKKIPLFILLRSLVCLLSWQD